MPWRRACSAMAHDDAIDRGDVDALVEDVDGAKGVDVAALQPGGGSVQPEFSTVQTLLYGMALAGRCPLRTEALLLGSKLVA